VIAKKKTSACVTNDISLEHIYENLKESECMFNLLKRHKPQGCSSPKGRKVKKQRYGNSSPYQYPINDSSHQLVFLPNYHNLQCEG
jgi:hypothetical protein